MLTWVPFSDSGRRGSADVRSGLPPTPPPGPHEPVSSPNRKPEDPLLLLDLRPSSEVPAARALEFRTAAAVGSSAEVVNFYEALGHRNSDLVQRRRDYHLYGNWTPIRCLFGDPDRSPSRPLAGGT